MSRPGTPGGSAAPLCFVVPVAPVGVNASYERRSMRGGGPGLRKTKAAIAYRDAIVTAGRAAMRGRRPFIGPVTVSLLFVFPSRRSDLDGPIKGTLDALQLTLGDGSAGAGIYSDDRQVWELGRVARAINPMMPRVEIEVRSLLDPAPDALLALRNVRMLVARHYDRIDEATAADLLRFCAEGGADGSLLRGEEPSTSMFAAPSGVDLEIGLLPETAADKRRRAALRSMLPEKERARLATKKLVSSRKRYSG